MWLATIEKAESVNMSAWPNNYHLCPFIHTTVSQVHDWETSYAMHGEGYVIYQTTLTPRS